MDQLLLSMREVRKKTFRKKGMFIFCMIASIMKAFFYGGIFAYEMKHIMLGVSEHNIKILYSSMFQLVFFVILVAVVDILYIKFKTRMINQIVSQFEDDIILKYNTCYYSDNTKNKLTILQNTIPNTINQAVEFIFGIIYLVSALMIAVLYGLTINIGIVVIGIAISSLLVFIIRKQNADILQKTKESEMATNEVFGKLWEYNDNIEILGFLEKKETYLPLDEAVQTENKIKIEASRLKNLSRIFMRFSNIGTILFAGVVGGILIYFGKLTASDLMALILLLPFISDQLFQIPSKINEYYAINGSCEVINQFFLQEEKWINLKEGSNLTQVNQILFSDFYYKIDEKKQLSVSNFIIKTGNIYGISGQSGAGKTTFFRILTKLIDSYEGRIEIDNFELHDINCTNWWNLISYVEQESILIPGNIYDNICLQEESKREKNRLKEAIDLAGLNEFIAERKNLEHEISIDSISSGEKQQICLARAYYRNRNIILLDEVTSALSPKRENLIMKNLRDWVKKNHTIAIVISHSSEVMEYCDKMIPL